MNTALAVITHLFTKAVEGRWVDQKPAAFKSLTEDRGRIVYLTTDQIDQLIDAALQDVNPTVYPFIVIGLESSMRRMEILSIRLEHISLNRRIIYISEAKAGVRQQPVTQHLADVLRGYIEAAAPGQEWQFPAPKSRTGHVVAIEKAFRRVVETAGLNPKEVVRHTAIMHLVQAGADLATVQ